VRKIEKICLVVTSEMTVTAFLKQHIMALSKIYHVTLVMNTDIADFAAQHELPINVLPLVITRNIQPIADLKALYALCVLFRSHRFDLVHSVTPKAGLLAMLAGKVTGVRFRLHTFTGQVWATRKGFSRLLLKTMDRLLALAATNLLADSVSQRQFLIDQGIAKAEKLTVLGDGSISGVDVDRFQPDFSVRVAVREQLGIDEQDMLLLFLGRLKKDKGVLDLAVAFAQVAVSFPNLHLVLVGPDEDGLKTKIEQMIASHQQLHFVDYTDKPERYFAAADIFCLPSYREGFGSVVIEAAACAVPTIGSRIYGVSDAVNDGETGLLFEHGNVDDLTKTIRQLLSQPELRREMGEQAMLRARKVFPVSRLVQAWLAYYDGLQ